MEEEAVRQVFFSAHHPGGRSKSAIAGTALVRPIGFCMLPVMISALVSMLQGYAALPFLTIGFPIAAGCALVWTWIRIRGEMCEVHIHGGSVAFRSLFEAALPTSKLNWKRVIHAELEGSHADVTLGLSTYRFDQANWPEWTTVVRALAQASTER